MTGRQTGDQSTRGGEPDTNTPLGQALLCSSFDHTGLQFLMEPLALHSFAPVADVPLAPGAEAAQRVVAGVNRHMHDRETVRR